MGACNIDHSHQDVQKKWESQRAFLPADLNGKLFPFLEKEHSQETLNEVFHLLKKYDLISKEEQEERNEKFRQLLG